MLRIIASFLGLLSINAVHSKAYIAGASKKSYADAQAYCITQGSNLATISSVSDQQDAELACPASISGEGCWFGLNDIGTEGSFSFIDGTPLTYENFADNEPNSGTAENCVELSKGYDFQWNDYRCSVLLYPLCNPAGSLACTRDEDCPIGLVCCTGAKRFCHPPPPSADQYFISVNAMTWDQGKKYCTGLGANFASVHSERNLIDIRYLCASSGAAACHIGMYMDAITNKWLWSDGSDSDYGFNLDGSPDGNIQPPWEAHYAYDGKNEKCQKMDIGGGGYFDDSDCDANFPVICYGRPPSAKAIGALSDLGENIKYNYNDIEPQPDYKNNNNNYYGYILLIGFIAFILINNVFIGCWCVRKKGQSDLQYEKCEVEVVNQ